VLHRAVLCEAAGAKDCPLAGKTPRVVQKRWCGSPQEAPYMGQDSCSEETGNHAVAASLSQVL
jgi:hypothetical protein